VTREKRSISSSKKKGKEENRGKKIILSEKGTYFLTHTE